MEASPLDDEEAMERNIYNYPPQDMDKARQLRRHLNKPSGNNNNNAGHGKMDYRFTNHNTQNNNNSNKNNDDDAR